MYAQRKLNEDCFENFRNHFTKTFQDKIKTYPCDVQPIFLTYSQIHKKITSVVNDWNRNQDMKAARDFWSVVGIGNKFLRHL